MNCLKSLTFLMIAMTCVGSRATATDDPRARSADRSRADSVTALLSAAPDRFVEMRGELIDADPRGDRTYASLRAFPGAARTVIEVPARPEDPPVCRAVFDSTTNLADALEAYEEAVRRVQAALPSDWKVSQHPSKIFVRRFRARAPGNGPQVSVYLRESRGLYSVRVRIHSFDRD